MKPTRLRRAAGVPGFAIATAAALIVLSPPGGGPGLDRVWAATYDVERYLNIRSASVAGLSRDATTVAFTTNVTGSNQLWSVAATGGWPEQITFFTDRIAAVDWSPRADWIAFSKDSGGDENFQLYLVTPDGSRLEALTSDPEIRNNFGAWSKDGGRLSYASNARNRKFFDVYVLEVSSRQSHRVLASDTFLAAGPFSPDGTKMIVTRQNGSLDNDLLLVHLGQSRTDSVSGGILNPPQEDPADLSLKGVEEPVLLTPHEGIASHRVVDWAPDGRSLWIVSDAGREFSALGRLDIPTKRITWERAPKWDVTGSKLSPDGRTLAFVVNEDGYDRLAMLDTATMKDKPVPPIPAGQIGALHFSKNGKSLALTLSGPAHTGDVWIADLSRGSLAQVTRSSTAGIPQSSFVKPKLVRYKSFDGLEIASWFYVPSGAAKGAGLPCIVTPHGGPEGQTTAAFSPTVQYYVNRGYSVWAPNVRGSTGYGKSFTHLDDVRKREDSVKDLVAGIDWLKSSGMIDPKKIAVAGGSYGGYMTLAAITLFPDVWAAAVDSFGIANFKTFFGQTASYRVGLRASEYGDPVKDADFLDSISPIYKVDRILAPLLVLQGANDPRVPRAEAEQIVAAIKKKGGIVEYVLFPDEGHGWTKLENRITALRTAADFLDKYVQRASQAAAERGEP
jgi:dipeptidyl aminopeptidase/acylaminoacyl peptidase